MAKLTRVFQRIFGQDADLTQMGKFGSLAEGSPENSKDPASIQSLDAWLEGWFGATIGANSPCIEDMNGAMFVFARQLAYIFQAGVSEWDSQTTYYQGSLVSNFGQLYVSLVDTNLNNAITDTTKWKPQGNGSRTVTATGNITVADDVIRVNGAAAVIMTLPSISSSVGKRFVVKNIGENLVQLKASGSELMDDVNNSDLFLVNPLNTQYGSMTVFNNGTTWDVI